MPTTGKYIYTLTDVLVISIVLHVTPALRGGEDPALQHPVRALRADRLPSQIGFLQARRGHAVCGSHHPRAWMEGLLQAAAGDPAWIQPVPGSQGLQQR